MNAYPKFEAPKWAENPHVQTILPRLLFGRRQIDGEWQDFTTSDGDNIEITWFRRAANSKGIICIFHGLEGSVESHYISTLLPQLTQDWHVAVVHFRGCGRRANKLPRSYHSGDTGDAKEIIESLQRQFPDTPLHALGFSLGGNMLLKLLGEYEASSPITSAIAVSPPFDLASCATSISTGFSKIYERHLLKSMRQKFRNKAALHDYQTLLSLSEQAIEKLSSFWAFDDKITGPLHGFKNADDYYAQCSATRFMSKINTRTLVLHAYDDPFMSPDIVPNEENVSECVTLEVSRKGGHVGFLQGPLWQPTLWLPGRIAHYFNFQK